jgi:ABC-2 type transport system permease protein
VLNVTRAFVRRDWLAWTSYRMGVLTNVIGVVAVVVLVSLIGSAAGGGNAASAAGGGYVPFVLAGLAFTDAFEVGLTSLPRAIRDGQLSGTLESVLLAPIKSWQLVTASGVFSILQAYVRCALFVGVGVVGLGYWHGADVPATLLVFVLGTLAFLGLGLLSAAMVLLFKQGDPIIFGYAAASALLGGTLFPTSALPEWLGTVSALFPLTHALSGVRSALDGTPISGVLPQIVTLAVMALVLVPCGLAAFRAALDRSRREGSLVHY